MFGAAVNRDADERVDRKFGADGLESRGEDVTTFAGICPDSNTDGVVDGRNGASAKTVCRSSVPGGDGLTSSHSRSALASNCDAGAQEGSCEGPDADAQVVAPYALADHVVHWVCFCRTNAISDQAVDSSIEAAPKLVSDETGDGGLAVDAPDRRREANDVVQLGRGILCSHAVVEWVGRVRADSLLGCGGNSPGRSSRRSLVP